MIIGADDIKEIAEDLRRSGETTEEEIKIFEEVGKEEKSGPISSSIINEGNDELDIRQLISEMKLPDKIKAAMLGNSSCRSMLIMDSNKMIQLCVLKNPKITEKEIEAIARNPNMSQIVLRSIADRKEWIKSYNIKLNIVTNPKTPGDLALKWLRYLNASDLKKIAKSKNLPSVVVTTARKKVAELDTQKQ